MKLIQHIVIGCALLAMKIHTNAQQTFLDNLAFRPAFQTLRRFFFDLTRSELPEEAFRANLKMGVIDVAAENFAFLISKSLQKLQRQFSQNESFFCDVRGPGKRSKNVPTSVHALRPGDIDIIGAIGDSLTAGNGGMATNIFQITIESKGLRIQCSIINKTFQFSSQGVSFSIGGEKTWREYLTIPNILKEFNPNLYGYSVSDGMSIFETSKFNAAELGAMSRDTPHMAKVLVRRMLSDRNVKSHHWKVKLTAIK